MRAFLPSSLRRAKVAAMRDMLRKWWMMN